MRDWPDPPRVLGKAKPESFGAALRAAIKAEYGTNKEFALALGFKNASSVTHFISGPDEVTPKTLRRIVETFSSPALQDRIHRAWIREFTPIPDLPEGISPEEFLSKVQDLFEAGLIRRALATGNKRLRQAQDPREWHLIADRVFQLNLRLERVSHAWQIRNAAEEKALELGSGTEIIAALAMRGTALRATDAATPGSLREAHAHTLSFLEQWEPKTPEEKERRRSRLASIWREYALCILSMQDKGLVSTSELQSALTAIENSNITDSLPHLSATALEVRSRIEVAGQHFFKAEETLDELIEQGLGLGWENWEKTQMTRAKVYEGRGERDTAIEILLEVRDYSLATENVHFFRKADQELSRLLAGL